MKGIVAVSYGNMAQGLVDSARFIMGDGIDQLEYCCLQKDDTADSFRERLSDCVEKADEGQGVIILADIASGNTFSAVIRYFGQAEVIFGINLPVLLELLIKRMSSEELPVNEIIMKARESIVGAKEYLANHFREETADAG